MIDIPIAVVAVSVVSCRGIAPFLKGALGARFAVVVHGAWVGAEGDLGRAARAFDVEAVDGDVEVFEVGGFLAGVEFAATVE